MKLPDAAEMPVARSSLDGSDKKRIDKITQATAGHSQQRQLLALAFHQNVVTDVEVLNRVQTIATEVGAELDRNWADCCQQMTESWQTSVQAYRASWQADDLLRQSEPLIRAGIREASERADRIAERPAISNLASSLGTSALLLLRLRTLAPQLAMPLFLVSALWHVFDYLLGLLKHRQGDYRTAISSRLALLGNRVGFNFSTRFAGG